MGLVVHAGLAGAASLPGVDLPTVKELLGHSSITTTMRYAHPSPLHRKTAVDSLVENETSRLLADEVFDSDTESTQAVKHLELVCGFEPPYGLLITSENKENEECAGALILTKSFSLNGV